MERIIVCVILLVSCSVSHAAFELDEKYFPYTCYECDSDTNANCVKDLSPFMEKECNFTRPGCYLIRDFNTDTSVKRARRGCLSDLDEETTKICSKYNKGFCKTCEGTNCNRQIAPSRCLDCTNVYHENCIEHPEWVRPKECHHYIDDCVTIALSKEITVRTCKSDSKHYQETCAKEPWRCTVCSTGDNCNTHHLSEKFCYACNSASNRDCVSNLNDSMLVNCPLSGEKLGCYLHINRADYTVSRGCLTDLKTSELQTLRRDKEAFQTCQKSYCNGEAIETMCNQESQQVGDKIVGTNLRACKNPSDRCFTGIHNELVERGCLDEYMKAENLSDDSMAERFNELYRPCDGTLCNDDVIMAERCYESDATQLTDKSIKPNLKKCRLKQSPVGCYHVIDQNDDVIARGCITDLTDDERQQLQANNNQHTYKECYSSGCNEKLYMQRCIQGTEDVTRPYQAHSGWQVCEKHDDKCFVHVSGNMVRRGCLDSARTMYNDGAKIVRDCEIGDFCETCAGQMDCNDNIIEAEHCIRCDSKNAPLCANEPHLGMSEKCPLAVRPLGCYISEHSEHGIERGCMSDLIDQDRAICADNENNYDCKWCGGESCNIRPYFQECFECDMHTNGDNCIESPTLVSLKRCKSYIGGGCYTLAKRGIFKRGCVDDLTQEDRENTNDIMHCSGPRGCNNHRIPVEKCFYCDSSTDSSCPFHPTFEVTCLASMKPSGCYHSIEKGTGRVQRGCLGALPDPSTCQNSDECKQCFGKKCNNQMKFARCMVCDSKEDPTCADDVTLKHEKMCGEYENHCFTMVRNDSITRGCFNDVDEQTRIECEKDPRRCEICNPFDRGNHCNSKNITVDTCVVCDSRNDFYCRNHPNTQPTSVCHRFGATIGDESYVKGCYLRLERHHGIRGCLQDLPPQEQASCINQSDSCKSCNGNNCNEKADFQRCLSCSSSDDPYCTRWLPEDSEEESINYDEVCQDYMGACVVGVDAKGVTHRRCTNDASDTKEFVNGLKICAGQYCNDETVPNDRLNCYQCEGDRFCTQLKTKSPLPLNPTPCNIFSTQSQCFVYIDDEQNLHRGCTNDESSISKPCLNEPSKCEICDEHGCNDRALNKVPSRTCIKCQDDTECAFGQISDKVKQCDMGVYWSRQEACFTRTHPNGIVERGCTVDSKEKSWNWCSDAENCVECSENGCNTANVRYHSCGQCSGDKDSDCATLPHSNAFIKQCDTVKHYPYAKRGCYTIKEENYIERGCLIDLDESRTDWCQHNGACTILPDENSNLVSFKSSAVVALASNILIVFTAFIVLW